MVYNGGNAWVNYTESEVYMTVQEQVYSIDEAAQILKVSPKTIRRMIDRGEIKSHRVGWQHRIPRSEIEKFSHDGEEKEDK
jgi:excisionase family DNA binding protein